MDIQDWSKIISDATYSKFPKKFSNADKILSLIAQIGDLCEKEQYLRGIRHFDKRPDHTIQEAIVGVLIDVLVMCDLNNIDINKELEVGRQWFLTNKEVR